MINTGIRAVKEAAKLSLNSFNKKQQLFRKAEDELVTQVDIACERLIKTTILKDFPDHGFLSEEEISDHEGKEYIWIIDPIDGTVNYSRGISLYGISVALAKNKDIILGIVYNPVIDELLVAERGSQALLNGKPIHVSSENKVNRSVIYTTELYKSETYVRSIYQKVKQFRVTSSSAYETCLVAMGRTEAFIKITSHPWGFAAANLIVESAGGKVTNFDGTAWNLDSTHILSSNGLIHQEILQLLNQPR